MVKNDHMTVTRLILLSRITKMIFQKKIFQGRHSPLDTDIRQLECCPSASTGILRLEPS